MFTAFTVWLLAGWGGPDTTRVVSDIGSLLASGAAALCAAIASKSSRGRERTAWAVLTLALAAGFVGDALWAYYELLGSAAAPFPSPADAAYLIFPVAASTALVLLPVSLSQTRVLLDGVTVAGSLFMIVWTLGLEDVVHRGYDAPLAVAVSLAYPIGDIVILTTATLMLTRSRRGQRAALAVFAVAAGSMALSDGAFVVLVEDGSDRPLNVAHHFYSCSDGPFKIDGRDLFVRPSLGAAVGFAGTCAKTAADTVLRQADLAMYTAKRSGQGGVALFTSDMHVIDPTEINPPLDRSTTTVKIRDSGLRLFAELRAAIDNGELTAEYQPKFNLTTGGLAGVEALVRWPHRECGLLMPAEFLPLAQRNGLMGALTDAVVHRAVCDATDWRAQGVDIPFSVNLFPPSLVDTGLPERLARLLDHGGLATGSLTERILLGNTERARVVLEMLQARGIRVSIDDFGIGYSDLSHLRGLPVGELMFDPEFTAPIVADERAEATVCAVINSPAASR